MGGHSETPASSGESYDSLTKGGRSCFHCTHRGASSFLPTSRRNKNYGGWLVAHPPPQGVLTCTKGGREGSGLIRTSSICGEVGMPSFPRGAHIRLVIARGVASKRPKQGGYLLVRICVRERGKEEGAGSLEGFNPLLNGSSDKHPPLFMFLTPQLL